MDSSLNLLPAGRAVFLAGTAKDVSDLLFYAVQGLSMAREFSAEDDPALVRIVDLYLASQIAHLKRLQCQIEGIAA